jgi:hypothetical protein
MAIAARLTLVVTLVAFLTGCRGEATGVGDVLGAERGNGVAALAGPLPSNGSGCAPGSRCIRVDETGRPENAGQSIAQCRGKFADFIVPTNTTPPGYTGPWFQPELIESATTTGPTDARPWQAIDPQQESARLAYLLTLRNYAFASAPVRSLTPSLTADADYFDSAGNVPATSLRTQRWYPAPRMIYGRPDRPGTREMAYGMTLERRVAPKELAGNTAPFVNYAVAYYDTRGAHTYERVWSTATPGRDVADRTAMQIRADGFVYKLLFSAAPSTIFPTDPMAGSVSVNVLPNAGGKSVPVRLLQMDIGVKDDRAGTTGWYFATYAFDPTVPGTSPWRKMVPVGLMWGDDPKGAPLVETWINPTAPAYAKAHLGVDGRLNGPVDNPASACLSCHGTAQAPSFADMIPPTSGPCLPQRSNWFRNLTGAQPFGRFDDSNKKTCETALGGASLTAGDYSLQLAATVTRSLTATTFNPCTWDTAVPPPTPAGGPGLKMAPSQQPRVFEITRDPPRR